MKWRKISSVPKDETPIDIWVPNENIEGGGTRYTDMMRVNIRGKHVFYEPTREYGVGLVKGATHWIKIEPPTLKNKKEEK